MAQRAGPTSSITGGIGQVPWDEMRAGPQGGSTPGRSDRPASIQIPFLVFMYVCGFEWLSAVAPSRTSPCPCPQCQGRGTGGPSDFPVSLALSHLFPAIPFASSLFPPLPFPPLPFSSPGLANGLAHP